MKIIKKGNMKMGLISCPKCGQTISDRANVCPHCNSNFSQQSPIICEECQTEYEASLSYCPNCGCPNRIEVKREEERKYKGILISVIAIILIATGILGFNIWQKATEREYYTNMETVSYAMLDGATQAETAGNLIKSVWYNAIYEKRDSETDKYTVKNGKFADDFNDALENLFADAGFIRGISEIRNNQSEVVELMKKLKNPPKKYREAYSALKVYYDNYLKMTKAVINPTGSLNTFSEDFNKYDTDTVNAYEKMKLYLD